MKSIDSGQSHLRLRIGSFSNDLLAKSIDSGQSHLLAHGLFCFQLNTIDSGQSRLQLRIASFPIEPLTKNMDSGQHTSGSELVSFQ